jgi:gluconokinase
MSVSEIRNPKSAIRNLLLCFDLSSGGATAALFDTGLKLVRLVESSWDLELDETGSATLSLGGMTSRFKQVVRDLKITEQVDAICIGSFMHNCVLLDAHDKPLTPVFTWLDRRGDSGLECLRTTLGDTFHQRTGCRFHPMFPVFKLAALRVAGSELLTLARRIVSIKAYLNYRLTGAWIEDHGMSSATGLYSIASGDWDSAVLELVGVHRDMLPSVESPYAVAGTVTATAAAEFGLPERTIVINGSGDGFLAHAGSHCETPSMISVTLGTSAVARQSALRPVLDPSSGTFCYRADEHTYLLGCAGNNGGNVLDWGRSLFGDRPPENAGGNLPIFIPLLHGERSPEWDPLLTGSWHGLRSQHTAAELSRSILEGVVFNLAHYVEILQRTSGTEASGIVLSGNGFLHPLAASILAALVERPVRIPAEPGLATLRGAAMCALRARGLDAPPFAAAEVRAAADENVVERFKRYKELRKSVRS